MKVNILLLAVALWQSTEAKSVQQIPKVTATAEISTSDQQSELGQELADAQLFLLAQKSEIQILNKRLLDLRNSESKIKTESSIITVCNLQMPKKQFITVSLAVSGFLLLLVLMLFWKMKRGSKSVVEAQLKLVELEQEYNQHIKTALEREQKIRRQLQDEINRRKISDAS